MRQLPAVFCRCIYETPNQKLQSENGSSLKHQVTAVIGNAARSSSTTRNMRRGVASGFGAERTEDALGDVRRAEQRACHRAAQRREGGKRGRMRDFNNQDLGRSAGGAWHMGKR